jgi:hypothetical protein
MRESGFKKPSDGGRAKTSQRRILWRIIYAVPGDPQRSDCELPLSRGLTVMLKIFSIKVGIAKRNFLGKERK